MGRARRRINPPSTWLGRADGSTVPVVDALLQGLLIATVTVATTVALTVLWVRHRLRRRLRIAPRVRSMAPTVFIVSPGAAARLHRRLRRVGATARLSAELDPALGLVADDLVAEALSLEPAVVAVARSGRAGRVARRDLGARVAELEAVALRLAAMPAAPLAGPAGTGPIRDRLAALEAARAEVAEIELRAGLLTHP
jgi:hypothetical protein